MSARRLYLDRAPGESRGAVFLDDRPERLIIARTGDPPVQALGAAVVSRVRRIERAIASAFLDLGEGPEAVLALTGPAARLAEGAAIEVEITAEARAGKGALVRLVGLAEGPPRLLRPGPGLPERLAAAAPGVAIAEGREASEAADEAEAAALAIDHPLPGGGSIAIEPTRALVAVDVDFGARGGGDARRAARSLNRLAIEHAARLVRLKGLGGLVVIDLVGAGHDGEALAAAAKAAFAPDQPGVSIGPISRFGLMQIARPWRERPARDVLCGEDGRASPTTTALRLLRALEREGRADGGARLVGRCAPQAAAAASPYISELAGRIGARFEIRPDAGLAPDQYEAAAL
jgi:Ribonuclease G/E